MRANQIPPEPSICGDCSSTQLRMSFSYWYYLITNFCVNRFVHYVPMPIVARLVPKISLENLGKYVQSIAKRPIPNLNEVIEVPLLESGKCRWLARPENLGPEDPVIIFIHGGGYALPAVCNHGISMDHIYENLNNKRVGALWLAYTLSTHARFPQQLREAAAVYETVTKTYKNVILIGDSCGAHLAISLLRHIHEPVNGVEPLMTSVKPQTLIAVSPWLDVLPDIENHYKSYDEFHFQDVFTYWTLRGFGNMAIPLDDAELAKEMCTMHLRDEHFWNAILPPNVLITYGTNETLRDSILVFIENAKLVGRSATTEIFAEEGGVHDSLVFEPPQKNRLVRAIYTYLNKLDI